MRSQQKKQKKIIPFGSIASRGTVGSEESTEKAKENNSFWFYRFARNSERGIAAGLLWLTWGFACTILQYVAAGWSSQVARRAHNPKVLGSNPSPAIKTIRDLAKNPSPSVYALDILSHTIPSNQGTQPLKNFIAPQSVISFFLAWGFHFAQHGPNLQMYLKNNVHICGKNPPCEPRRQLFIQPSLKWWLCILNREFSRSPSESRRWWERSRRPYRCRYCPSNFALRLETS